MYLSQSPFRPRGLFGSFATALALLVIALPAAAADADRQPLSEEQGARLDARIEELRGRLALTDEQKAALEPVLRKDFERRVAILRQHGVTRESEARPTRREARALRRDLQAAREEAEEAVERILDDRQIEEYRKVRDEARDAMREQRRSRRQDVQQ